MRVKLRRARRGSKHWWRLSNQIANRSGGSRGVPALQRADGSLCLSASEKANLLADTFCSKFGLPSADDNEYSFIGEPLYS